MKQKNKSDSEWGQKYNFYINLNSLVTEKKYPFQLILIIDGLPDSPNPGDVN